MNLHLFPVVRMKGLEPPLLPELDPKSSAATNYATCAKASAKLCLYFVSAKLYWIF